MKLHHSFLPLAFAALALTSLPAMAQAPGAARTDCILDRCGDKNGAPPAPASQGERPAPRENRGFERAQQRDPDNRRFDDRRFDDRRFDDRRDNRRFDDRREPRRGGDRGYGSTPGQFDFYVLALSWSPSFCNSEAGRRSRNQCAIGANLGFVVHGLWPQFERGSPSYCDERNPPRAAMDRASGVFPEEGLARYQWRKHGSCSGLAPAAYFDAVRRARDLVIVPDELKSIRQPGRLDPRNIERAFVAANRTLRPGMLAVTCTRGQLQEVRVCMNKDLRTFRPCPEVARAACPIGTVQVPPPR
jgi:ribonuclease T2